MGIILAPVAEGTEVRLRQTGLPAGEPPLAHVAGWRNALATLAFAGAADQLAPVLAEHIGMVQQLTGGGRVVGRGARRPATAWSALAGRPSARARPSWRPPAPTWPGPTWTAGSGG
ncbi:MAG TPA: hypothetical protein VLA80_03150 [Actinomycetota bacterium]|nr:hypothetical protein [Actinomycetota bacterium]